MAEAKKRCTACENWLDFDEFHRDSKSPDGRVRKCKLCTKMNRGAKKPITKSRSVSLMSIRLSRAINTLAKRMKIPVNIQVNNDTTITVTIKGETSDEE
ncbi:hypothetical protein [Bacillus phage CP-51]|uniref:Uncharacterized protein n=1 Tax=Bacillus phage CP-51 TaxID=1391188 RepID=A0A068EME9_9CAUD|nr:hypothetical protein OZ73_gp108 [Bacillus phage CP-51]AID50543.1 hypothetical protein [Bacillus phage CP-51]